MICNMRVFSGNRISNNCYCSYPPNITAISCSIYVDCRQMLLVIKTISVKQIVHFYLFFRFTLYSLHQSCLQIKFMYPLHLQVLMFKTNLIWISNISRNTNGFNHLLTIT
ncbi:hypothetical protein Hanom_Chr10g00966051 [Helianthus anomalus]